MSGRVAGKGGTGLPLIAVGLMLGGLVVAAGLARRDAGRTEVPASLPVLVRNLSFDDLPDGSIAVRDAATGAVIETVTGQAGFLRATVRGLAQQRQREAMGSVEPFRLTAWADGRLTLDDPDTRRHIELEAFGSTNEAVFAQLLTAKEAKP